MTRSAAPSTDLVVVLPGIMGSTLSRDGRPVWALTPGALVRAIRVFGDQIGRLRLPDGIGDEHPGDGVEPSGLMADLHVLPGLWTPVKGYDVLVDHLRRLGYREGTDTEPGNLLPVPYDWRLSNRHNGRRLGRLVEPALERWRAQGGRFAQARLVFVAHSMGGLVARWYIEREGGAELTRKLVTLGTPYRGAAKALVQLVNGVPSGLGRLAPDLTALARSMPSMYQLMPEYACVTGEPELRRTVDLSLPDLPTSMVTDAMTFHTDLRTAEEARAAVTDMTHAIVGSAQPTWTTVSLSGGVATPIETYRDRQLYGDSTVPLTGGVRAGVALDSPLLRRVADKHGNLQRNQASLDEIEGILTGQDVVVRAGTTTVPEVRAPELLLAGEPLVVELELATNSALLVTVTDEHDAVVDTRVPRLTGGTGAATFDPLPPGGYTVTVSGSSPASPVAPVTAATLVWSDHA